ncbi:MAG: hypothetical protein QG640_338, partial [Patescibacteria group bacterium]|nr:hypothetical protein [Patescibacteria group bacterium]
NGTLVGSRVLGSTGTIIGGGAQNPVDGFYWWKIDYDNTTVDGYSGQGTLKLASTNQPTPFTVTTAKAGTGSGTVSCNPSTCTANTGSTVVVNGSATSGSTLVGFTVSPTSAGTCTTTSCTLTAVGTVTATFNLIPVTGVDTTKPSVTTFTVPSTSSSLTVSTSIVASDNIGVIGYLITESATAPSVTASGWTLASPTSYTFASAGAKTLYAWAKDLAGNVSLSRSASVTVTITAAKFTIPQSVIPNGVVNVRQTAAGTLLGTQSTTVSGTTLAGPVTATLNGTSYQWWNINFTSGVDGWVGQDGLDAYTPPAPDTQAPTVPSGLTAAPVSSTQINLAWNASTDNVGVAGYNVYRNGVLQTNPNPTARTFQSAGLSADTSYSYTVSAYDAVPNTSAQTASVSARTQQIGAPTAIISSGSVSVVSGQSTTITWASVNATACTVTKAGSNWQTGIAGTNVSTGALTVATTFSVVCTGINGTSPTASVTVNIGQPGGNWYLNDDVSTSGNGQSWATAWKTPGSIIWSNIKPGDTLWIAGGTYTTGLSIGSSGTAANPIRIKRVRSSDAIPVSSAGWSSAHDSRATFTSSAALSAPVSYVEIDGQEDMGLRFVSSNSGGLPTSFLATGGNYVTVSNVDLVGPNSVNEVNGDSVGTKLANHAGDGSGVNIGYGGGSASNITIKNSRVRGHPNEFWFANATNIVIENNKIYDNGAANSAQWHGNLMIVNKSDGIIFRNNDVYNWQVEGLYPWGSPSRNWYVYGNVFHDGIGGKNGSTHRFLELRSYSGSVTHGPFYVYNNTITNAWAAITRGDTTVNWSADSVVRNNLVYNVANGGIGYLPATASHNFTASADPFTPGTFKLSAPLTVSENAAPGTPVSNVTTVLKKANGSSIVTDFEKDPTGKTRGADGVWDVGAYEF